MFFRLAVVSFILGISAFTQFRMPGTLAASSIRSIYFLISVTYLFSILNLALLKTIKSVSLNVYFQSTFDILLVTTLVYVTGGIGSVYSPLYPLIIIYSVLFLGKNGGVFVASASGILYGLLVDLEFYGVIHPIYSRTYLYSTDPGHVFLKICVHIVSFYTMALLTSFVVDMEKKTKTLLSEKETAFDQLDILYKSIIESVGSGIMTVDLEGRIKSCNKAAGEITGMRSCEVENRAVDDIFPDFSEAIRTQKDQNKNLSTKRFEIAFSSTSGQSILGFSIYPLIDPEENNIGNIFIFQDLTVFKKMEEEIEKNRKLAFMGEMSAVLAHELRSPLVSISGSIRLLMEDLKLEGSNKKLMKIILMGKEQLENLVRDFLLLARPDTRNRCKIDIQSVTDEVIESVRFSPGWNGTVNIIKNLCDQNETYGNRMEIRQVLWNVVLNSLQAMPDGGVLEIGTKHDTYDGSHEFLEISVKDTGCGIEKKHLSNVLDPFFTTKENGTGLGLAIVSRIIESHNGRLRIESEPGKGTKCSIFLPAGSGQEG